MKPVNFEGATVLGAPRDWDAETHGPCVGLPVMRRDGTCISLWQATWRERIKLLWHGQLWLHIASGQTQPPVSLEIP